jgi:hypothetical protein
MCCYVMGAPRVIFPAVVALHRFDPLEVVAIRGNLSAATLAVLKRHCSTLGAAAGADERGSPAGAAVPLTLLPPQAADQVPALLQQYLALLPAELQHTHQGPAGQPDSSYSPTQVAAAQRALALAVQQLQEAGLAASLLPAVQMAPLGLAGPCEAAAGSSCGPAHLVLDDRCITTLELLEVRRPVRLDA